MVVGLVLMSACAIESSDILDGEQGDSDRGSVSQGWYSTDPYDQHGWMTYEASRDASGLGISWQCEEEVGIGGLLGGEWDYTGQLCDTNVWTDDTQAHSEFFYGLYDAENAESRRLHSMRQGAEPAMTACAVMVANVFRATRVGLQRRSAGWSTWQRPIGTVTHTIQDSFAPAHARRISSEPGRFTDLCSIHESVADACRHTDDVLDSSDDADDNPFWRDQAVEVTADYLVAVAKMATDGNEDALYPFVAKWFNCPVEGWVSATL